MKAINEAVVKIYLQYIEEETRFQKRRGDLFRNYSGLLSKPPKNVAKRVR